MVDELLYVKENTSHPLQFHWRDTKRREINHRP